MNKKRQFYKTYLRSIFGFLLVAFLMILGSATVKASTTLVPYTLKTGTESDLTKAATYSYTADGTSTIPLKIEKRGCLLMEVQASRATFVNIELHNKADASDFPTYLSAQCTDYNGGRDTVELFLDKGTYYLKLPQNTYTFKLLFYSNEKQNVKNNSTIAAYCDHNNPAEFTYKATKNGYISINQTWLRGETQENSVTLYDSKGNNISNEVCDHKVDEPVLFPVKKGQTYKVNITTVNVDGKEFYKMKLTFVPRENTAGASKKKAKAMTFAKEIDGIIYGEDSEKKEQWYKFTNKKSQKLNLTITSEVSSGGVNIFIYDSSMRRIGKCNRLPAPINTYTYALKDKNKSKTIPKGTYYIKVVKSQKVSTAIYSLKVKVNNK